MSDNKGNSQPNSEDPKGFEEHKPSGRKVDGPSMKERLLAARKAEADGPDAAPLEEQAPAKIPAKKPTQKPAARNPVVGKGKAKAAASDDGDAAPKPARKAAGTRKPGGIKRTSTSSKRRAAAADAGDDEESPRRGRRAAPEKKSNAPMIGGLVAMAVLAAGAWKFSSGGDDKTTAAADTTATDEDAAVATVADDQEAADQMAAIAAAAEQAKEDAAAEAAEAQAAEEAAAAKKEAMENLPDTEAPRNSKTGRQRVLESIADDLYVVDDPAEPQLQSTTDFPRFGRVEGTTDEEWEDIEKMVGRMFDPMAGARGNRAKFKLEGVYGKQAFPAIVNGMLDLDYTDEDDNRSGDVGQKCLQDIANGSNAGWRYKRDTEPNKVAIMNRRTVEKLYRVWAQVLKTPAYWLKYAKLDKQEAEPEEDEMDDLDGGDDLDDLDGGDDLDDL